MPRRSRNGRPSSTDGRNGRARPGTLVIIGGAEDRDHDADVLRLVAERVGRGRLVVMTCATEEPEAAWEEYRKVFTELGVTDLAHVDIRDRGHGMDRELISPLEGARGVFFTGGDQLRITSHIGDTPAYHAINDVLSRGGIVAGTSAGASAMSETMLVDGESANTPRIGEIVRMAPGLGLLNGVVIDMHFAERGRLGRLLGVIAQNPRVLGVGIDEDTAIVVEGDEFTVVGAGGVYVVDGRHSSGSNVSEGADDETLAIEHVTLHLISAGRGFDLALREPRQPAVDAAA